MAEDLQSLLEKINREGVEKANAAAEKIISEAKAKAADILKNARAEAETIKSSGSQAAEDYAARARETIAQASRDTILKVERAVTAMLENILTKNVSQELANPETISKLIREALSNLTGEAEIVISPKVAKSLQAQFANDKNLNIVLDENMASGFSVRTDNARVEHSFTGKVVAEELAKRLRPDLAALLK